MKRPFLILLLVLFPPPSAALQQTAREDQTLLDWSLLNAIEQGDLTRARIALDGGADVNAVDYHRNSALHLAGRSNRDRVAAVRLILERKPNVEAREFYEMTPLMRAVSDREPEVARLLLAAGANPDSPATRNAGRTTLQYAIGTGDLDLIRTLVERGADVNLPDPMGWTPLMSAVVGAPEIVEYLLDQGARVNARNYDGRTALHWVLESGSGVRNPLAVVALLIGKGAETGIRDRLDATAEQRAKEKKDPAVLAEIRKGVARSEKEERVKLSESLAAAVRKGDRAAAEAILEQSVYPADALVFEAERLDDLEMLALLAKHDAWLNASNEQRLTVLTVAILNGHHRFARALVERGAPVGLLLDGGPMYPLAAAVQSGSLEMVQFLLAKRANVQMNLGFKVGDKPYRSPIELAEERGRRDLVDALVGAGMPRAWRSQKRGGPLIAAVQQGDLAAVKACIEKGEDLHARGAKSHTALTMAAEAGHLEIVRALLAAKVDLEDRHEYGSPLLVAVEKGHEAVVRALVDAGADVNPHIESLGMSPLHRAAVHGHAGIVRLLLDKGANPAAMHSSPGRTALDLAIDNKKPAVVKAILDQGGIWKGPYPGYTPLMLAAVAGDLPRARQFVARGGELSARDKSRRTALFHAVDQGHAEIADLLLEKGADPRQFPTGQGHMVLFAFVQNSAPLLQVFLKHGLDPNFKGSGESLLSLAALSASPDLMRILLDRGADVESKDARGVTVLMRVAEASGTPPFAKKAAKRGGFAPVVKLLLEKGARADARDAEGKTALDYAQEGEGSDLLEILRKAGK